MPQFRSFRLVVAPAVLLIALGLPGCASTDEHAPPVAYSTLPSREMQAIYEVSFAKANDAVLQVVIDELGYTLSLQDVDADKGRGRFNGSLPDGGSVRLETERSRDHRSTAVRVLAVPSGASAASLDREREILQSIENILGPKAK